MTNKNTTMTNNDTTVTKKETFEKEDSGTNLFVNLYRDEHANVPAESDSDSDDDNPRKPREYAKDIVNGATFTTEAVWVGDEAFVGVPRVVFTAFSACEANQL